MAIRLTKITVDPEYNPDSEHHTECHWTSLVIAHDVGLIVEPALFGSCPTCKAGASKVQIVTLPYATAFLVEETLEQIETMLK